MRIRQQRSEKCQRGLTAVEIVLALALVLLVGSVVLRSTQIMEPGTGPQGTIDQVLLEVIQQAHVLARTEHQTVEMRFNEEDQKMVLVALPLGEVFEFPLPQSDEAWEMEFWRREPDTDLTGSRTRAVETISRSRLIFHPQGGTSPAMIRVRRGMEIDRELWLEPFSAHWQNAAPSL